MYVCYGMQSIGERKLYQHDTEEHIDGSSGLDFNVQEDRSFRMLAIQIAKIL